MVPVGMNEVNETHPRHHPELFLIPLTLPFFICAQVRIE